MSKRLHLLGTSGLALCTAACGFPRPPDIGPDGGSDSAVAPSIVASNSVTPADLAAGIKPLVVPAGATYVIDTDQGAMYDAGNGDAPIRVAGAGVKDGVFYRIDDQNRAFFAVESLMVGEGATLRGIGTRALVLVANGAVDLHGILDVSAGHCSITADGLGCAGPGGGRGGDAAAAAGCSPGELGGSSTGAGGGGGGGGFASSGGAGGAGILGGSTIIKGGAGGSGMGCLGPTLDPIHGGSGGHHGGGFGPKGPGGGGGGAVQVSSYTSIALVTPAVANTGGVRAGGAGGGGGSPGGSSVGAGSGGGAGGAILLEAPVINIRMGVVLAANGGGGGAGAAAVDGKPGQFGSAPASGGFSEAPGGAGAAGNANAIDGTADMTTQPVGVAGGGGGGGLGRIRINAIMLNLSDQAVLSPAPSLNMLPAS